MADDASIVISGDARGAVRALQQVSQAADGARASLAKMSASDTQAGAAAKAQRAVWSERADDINAWKRASSGVAPQLSGIIDSFEEFAEGASKVGGATMAARAGILAMATAWTAAATATVAAGAAMVASSIEVITHLSEYSGVATRHRDALESAAMATGALHEQVTGLRVEIAGQMAPTIEQASYALAGMVASATDAAVGVESLTGSIGASAGTIARYTPVLGDAIRLYDQLADRGRQAQMDAAAAAFGASAAAQIRAGMSPKFDMEADAAAAAAAQAEADAMMLVAKGQAAAATATRANTTAHVEQAPVVDEAIRRATEYASRLHAQAVAYNELLDAERKQAEQQERIAAVGADTSVVNRSNLGMEGADIGQRSPADIAKAIERANRDAAAASAGAWVNANAGIIQSFATVTDSIVSMSVDMASGQIRASANMSAHQRQEMRDQWRRQRNAALAQASIQAALGFVTTLASVPYPVNLVLAALGAVASGVQIAKIANTPPPNIAHTGAVLAPDERDVSVRMLASERLAVIPARGGMTSGDMARNATGEAPSAAAAPRVYIVTPDAGLQRTRPYAGMRPGMGWAMAG